MNKQEFLDIITTANLATNDVQLKQSIAFFSELSDTDVENVKSPFIFDKDSLTKLEPEEKQLKAEIFTNAQNNVKLIREHFRQLFIQAMKAHDNKQKETNRKILTHADKIQHLLNRNLHYIDPPKLKDISIQKLFSMGFTDDAYTPKAVIHEIVQRLTKTPSADLKHGPLLKAKYTYLFEDLVKQILDNEKMTYFLNKAGDHVFKLEGSGKEFNLSQIMQHVNMAHVAFSQATHLKYVEFVHAHFQTAFTFGSSGGIPSEDDYVERDPENEHQNLSLAEKLAITLYSGSQISPMNALLRNQITSDDFPNPAEDLKKAIINCAMCSSGLNKIPYKSFSVGFRGENNLPPKILERWLNAVHKGEVTFERGFISTSCTRLEMQFQGNVNIIFTGGLIGQDISKFSEYPTENEVLMVPTQVAWRGVQKEGDNYYFHAQPVRTLSGLTPDQQEMPEKGYPKGRPTAVVARASTEATKSARRKAEEKGTKPTKPKVPQSPKAPKPPKK